MNLLAKRIGLLTLLTLVLSCEEPNEIGLDLNPDLQNLKVSFTEIPLETFNVLLDSTNTSNNGRLLVGHVADPVFGTTKATGFTQVRPVSFNPTIQDGTSFDSLVVYMKGTYTYGQGNDQAQTLSIHQLTEEIVDTAVYYNFDKVDFNAQSIGGITFVPKDQKNDTFQLTVRIDDALGEDLYARAKNKDDETFDTQSKFNDYFKGLAIVADQANDHALAVNLNDTGTKMVMYYSSPNDAESKTFELFFNRSSINSIAHFANIEANRGGTVLESITESYTEYEPLENKIYLQSGTGLYPKINLDGFKDFIKDKKLVINRADLIIEDIEAYDQALPPPESVFFFITDDTNNFVKVSSSGGTFFRAVQAEPNSPFGFGNELRVEFSDEDIAYEGSISFHLQLVIDEIINSDEDFLIIPINSSSTLNQLSFDRSKVKLRLYYSTFE